MAAHGVLTAHAAYVHADTKRAAPRTSWAEAEDTWSMLLGRDAEGREEEDTWALAESVEKWDKRWVDGWAFDKSELHDCNTRDSAVRC